MERLHMNYLRDIIHRLRCGESQRRIARDTGISRPTIQRSMECWLSGRAFCAQTLTCPTTLHYWLSWVHLRGHRACSPA
jgi:hypothetical protein